MTTLAQLNAAYPSLQGPGLGLGDLLNVIGTNLNADSAATAASDTVTIGGTAHAGDLVTVTVNGFANSYTSLAAGDLGTGTVTVGGTVETGDVCEVTVAGNTVIYQLGAGDTTTTIAAASITTALNANSTFAASFTATSALAVITITAKLPGTAGNATLAVNVGGHLPTTTLTVSGGTLTGGTNGDTLTTIATAIKSAINADPNAGGLVTATSSGAVVTLTAKRKGTAANAYTLTAAVTGSGATVTATAAAATFGGSTAGTGNNDVLAIF